MPDANPTAGFMQSMPIESLFGGLAVAVIKADIIASQATADFVEKMGKDKDGKVVMTTLAYEGLVTDADQKLTGQTTTRKITMPYVGGVVEPPSFGPDEVEEEFEATIDTSEQQKTTDEAGAKVEASAGWIWGKASLSASYSHKSENTRSTDTRARLKVRMVMKRRPLAEGLRRALDIILNDVTRVVQPTKAA
jgi:uncharacterized protein DUF2589